MIRPSFEEVWLTTASTLAARSTCRRLQVGCVIVSADNRRVLSAGYNGGARGQENDCASMEPGQCFTGSTVVRASDPVAISRRSYSGPIVRVITSHGDFAVTPNHPILAAGRGWIPAQLLAEGDYLFHPSRAENETPGAPYDDNGMSFEEVFEAADVLRFGVRRSAIGHQFHGDCSLDERVDVVPIDRRLWNRLQPRSTKGSYEPFFTGSDHAHRSGASRGTLRQTCGSRDERASLLGGHLREPIGQNLRSAPPLYTGVVQPSIDDDLRHAEIGRQALDGLPVEVTTNDRLHVERDHRLPLVPAEVLGDLTQHSSFSKAILNRRVADAEGRGDLEHGLSRLVATHKVVAVERDRFSRHVYNLQTRSGWYRVGSYGSIVHNCGHLHAEVNACIRCTEPPEVPKHVYCTDLPCAMCARALVNLGGVVKLVYKRDYRIRDGLAILEKDGVQIVQRVKTQADELMENLTATQARCTELLTEVRVLKAKQGQTGGSGPT